MNIMTIWRALKNDLTTIQENLNAIELKKDLIRTIVAIRENFNILGIYFADCSYGENSM